jgi:hypothetical protein
MSFAAEDLTDPGDEAPTKRSSALGIVIFVVAVVCYLGIPALIVLAIDLGLPPAGAVLPAQVVVPLVLFAAISMIAIVAAVTRRGRGWAIAALVIAVANSYSPIHLGISDVIRTIFG